MVPAAYVANSVPVDASTSVRDATTTLAPCPAKPTHIARPMPRLPPVTSATLSRNVIATPLSHPLTSDVSPIDAASHRAHEQRSAECSNVEIRDEHVRQILVE